MLCQDYTTERLTTPIHAFCGTLSLSFRQYQMKYSDDKDVTSYHYAQMQSQLICDEQITSRSKLLPGIGKVKVKDKCNRGEGQNLMREKVKVASMLLK